MCIFIPARNADRIRTIQSSFCSVFNNILETKLLGSKRTANRRVGFSGPGLVVCRLFVGVIALVRLFGCRQWSSGVRGGSSTRHRAGDHSGQAARWRMRHSSQVLKDVVVGAEKDRQIESETESSGACTNWNKQFAPTSIITTQPPNHSSGPRKPKTSSKTSSAHEKLSIKSNLGEPPH